jgi:phage terminase small subunit
MAGKLTPQQRALVKNLAKGMTLTEAAIQSGYSENNARQSGYQALEGIRTKMPELLDRHGLTDESLIDKYLRPALEAEETKFAQKDGLFTDAKNVISWGPRLTALDMAFNLKGSFPQRDKNSIVAMPVQIITNITLPSE